MFSSLLGWFRGNDDRETSRRSQECRKCRLIIHYDPEKAGRFIYCPRCRVSIRLGGKRAGSTMERALARR